MHVSTPRRLYPVAALCTALLFTLSCGGDGGSPSPTPSSVVVMPGADTLVSINETRTLAATVLDANGDPIDGAPVSWSAVDPTVISVDATTGVATAHKNGSTQIRATSGALQGSAELVVVQIVTSVTVTPGNVAFTAVGDTARFTAVAKDAGNTPVVGVQILWSVSDNTVATIDTLGLATAKGPGTVLVSAQAQTRAGYAALSVTQAAAKVVITSAPATGTAGEPFGAAVQVEVRDSNDHRLRNAAIPVTIGVKGGDGAFGMVGISTLTTVDGAASFQNVGVTRAGAIQLSASAPGIDTAFSPALAVAGGAPKHLTVLSFADTMVAGDSLDAAVGLLDAYDNPTAVDGVVIGVSMRREYAPGLFEEFGLEFPSSKGTTAGVVDHWGTRVVAADSTFQLVFTSPGFDSVYAGPIAVLPGAPSRTLLTFIAPYFQQMFVGVGAPRSTGLQAWITDSFGNLNRSAPPTLLTVTLFGWNFGTPADGAITQQVGGTFSGTTANGILDLPAVQLRRPGMTDLRAVGGGYLPFHLDFEGRLYDKHGLAVGGKHACLLSESGPYCWGDNGAGQLTGLGAKDSVARPVQGVPTFVSLTAGDAHTCGLTAAGVAWCWGKNSAGQLGRSTTTASEPVPQAVSGAVTFSALVAGGDHTCGIGLADSTAYCWGSNASGELGDSTTTARNVPTQVFGGIKFVQLAAGTTHTCGVAVGSTGTAYCWGDNSSGQVGAATTSPSMMKAPRAVAIDSVVTIAAGDAFSCAEVRAAGGDLGVWCWGQSDLGRLGTASAFVSSQSTPAAVPGLAAVTQGGLVAGYTDACAIETDFNSYKCWGENGAHQISDQAASITSPSFLLNGGGANPGEAMIGNGLICRIGHGNPGTYPDTYCLGVNDAGQIGRGRTGFDAGYGTRTTQ